MYCEGFHSSSCVHKIPHSMGKICLSEAANKPNNPLRPSSTQEIGGAAYRSTTAPKKDIGDNKAPKTREPFSCHNDRDREICSLRPYRLKPWLSSTNPLLTPLRRLHPCLPIVGLTVVDTETKALLRRDSHNLVLLTHDVSTRWLETPNLRQIRFLIVQIVWRSDRGSRPPFYWDVINCGPRTGQEPSIVLQFGMHILLTKMGYLVSKKPKVGNNYAFQVSQPLPDDEDQW
ncbi:hypothetical protein COOONC_01812 [Cooperia oncophora]